MNQEDTKKVPIKGDIGSDGLAIIMAGLVFVAVMTSFVLILVMLRG